MNSEKCNLINLHDALTRFWEIEEGDKNVTWSKEEVECEEFFRKTVKRVSNGQYEVALLFNSKLLELGNSYLRALKRLKALLYKFE